jgi:hypothetical protein
MNIFSHLMPFFQNVDVSTFNHSEKVDFAHTSLPETARQNVFLTKLANLLVYENLVIHI